MTTHIKNGQKGPAATDNRTRTVAAAPLGRTRDGVVVVNGYSRRAVPFRNSLLEGVVCSGRQPGQGHRASCATDATFLD